MCNRIDAVKAIVNADCELRQKVLPLIDEENGRVDWYSVFNMDYRGNAKAALFWAYAIYSGQNLLERDLFKEAGNLSPNLRSAVYLAIGYVWDLS